MFDRSNCPYGCRGAAAAVEILSSTRVHVSQSTTELTDFQMPKLLCPAPGTGKLHLFEMDESGLWLYMSIYQGRQPRAQIGITPCAIDLLKDACSMMSDGHQKLSWRLEEWVDDNRGHIQEGSGC